MTTEKEDSEFAAAEQAARAMTNGCAGMVKAMPRLMKELDGPHGGSIAACFTSEMLDHVRELRTALGEFLEQVDGLRAKAN